MAAKKPKSSKMCKRLIKDTKKKIVRLEKERKAAKAKVKENEAILNDAVEKDYILFFEHDLYNECCTVQDTIKGVRVKETFKLSEIV